MRKQKALPFQAAVILIREVRYLECEFSAATESEELDETGERLRSMGRRMLDLADEFVPKVCRRARRVEIGKGELKRRKNYLIRIIPVYE